MRTEEDLARSGLAIDDLETTQASAIQLEACGVPLQTEAYCIPYFDIDGNRINFYRLRLHEPIVRKRKSIRYVQPKQSPSHVYFPKGFVNCFTTLDRNYIVITEGEKKSAAAVKLGIPTIGLGGVYNWRNRIFNLRVESLKHASTKNETDLVVKLESGTVPVELTSVVAIGFKTLVEFAVKNDAYLVIVYDTDKPEGLKVEVQKASADLATHLVLHEGFPYAKIRQLVLPYKDHKVGLDDFLVMNGAPALERMVQEVIADKKYIPRHHNPKELIDNALDTQLSRGNVARLSMAILSDLDANGHRIMTSSDDRYYFDNTENKLYNVYFKSSMSGTFDELPFGAFLYRKYGLTGNDTRMLAFLGSMFSGEGRENIVIADPAAGLRPYGDDALDVQVGKSHIARVTADSIIIIPNGQGTLFRSDAVEDLDVKKLITNLQVQSEIDMDPWWLDVFKSMNIEPFEGVSHEGTMNMLTCLFYISPWLNRWRGTQFPFEMYVAQPASGKTGLMQLRTTILVGSSGTGRLPSDIRDWHASIAAAPGFWYGDNVGLQNNATRREIADEICRLITDPKPHITFRKYYTTNAELRVPIHTTFAITSISQQFHQADLMQRSTVIQLSPIPDGKKMSNWYEYQLNRRGGREAWLAHHLLVIKAFMNKARGMWIRESLAQHRLANYEQCMSIMASVLGMSKETINAINVRTGELDPTMEALQVYAMNTPVGTEFNSSHVVHWASRQDMYDDDAIINNSRRCGRYMQTHVEDLKRLCGIERTEKRTANLIWYRIVHHIQANNSLK